MAYIPSPRAASNQSCTLIFYISFSERASGQGDQGESHGGGKAERGVRSDPVIGNHPGFWSPGARSFTVSRKYCRRQGGSVYAVSWAAHTLPQGGEVEGTDPSTHFWGGGASTAPQEGLVCDTAAVGTLTWSQYTRKNLEARGYASQPGAIGEGRGREGLLGC